MTHFTPRGQVIEDLRAKLRDAENQIDDMYRQKKENGSRASRSK